MFGLGILDYLKAGIIVALVAAAAFFWWERSHNKNLITELRQEVESLKLRADIIEKAQKATDEYLKKRVAVQRRVTGEKSKVDKAVESGDDAAMRDMFINRGLLAPGKASSPPSRP